ncbi:hypothetical protein ACQPZX_33265 [Actinoplanes sp. CA-142083]|uniref:hypothetical protein n=1 Tax=Actinoplanes sp. CA-142083 TaxID=3239903 RepID=UPI003D932C3A
MDDMNGTIHGGVHNYYQVPEGASAGEKFEFARNYLASGQATTARKLLADVTAEIRYSNEMWFFWMLAFYSGRTRWELSAEDRAHWRTACEQIDDLPRDSWSPGIDVIRRLAGNEATQDEATLRDLDALDAPLRDEILRHLERVLRGALKDELWLREVTRAVAEQNAERRQERVWKFFEPEPAEPRARRVRGPDYSAAHLALAVLAGAVVAGALGTIGWLALGRDDTSALVALTVTILAAGVALMNGADWRFRLDQARAEERRRRAARFPGAQARPPGFAATVDRMYTRYARRCGEEGAERAAWLLDAYLPLCRLRDDLVEAYRENRVKADRVRWLIRFQVRELYRQWSEGTPLDPRQRWAVPAHLKALTAIGTVAALAATVWAVQAAARQDPVYAAEALIALILGAWVAVPIGLRIAAENRRFAAERIDHDQRLTASFFEFQRWRHRLSDRPSDIEMARWLECDRRILLRLAMRMHQLSWSDISAYASLEAPGPDSRKARAKNGPWRYSRYRLFVFLLTVDGVRQITVELDFEEASLHHWERTNYRYEAVAAVRVTLQDDGAREFQLFLVNGADIDVPVTEPGGALDDEDQRILADGAQDATGLRNTLFVLEGVAAEGRKWWKGAANRR